MLNTEVLLKKLADHFKEYEEQFEFLRWIDERSIDEKLSIENIFYELEIHLSKIFKTRKIGIYARVKNKWFPFKYKNDNKDKINEPKIPKNFILPKNVQKGNAIIVRNQQNTSVSLLVPIQFHSDILIIILLQDEFISDESSFLNSDIIPFVEDVAKRISILINYKESKRVTKIKDDLITAYFEHQLTKKLTANGFWGKLTEFISLFLPDWSPLKVEPSPLVQILTYNEGDRYMTLRPTKDSYNSIPLKVDSVICGLLIEQQKDFLLVNPSKEYTNRYKAYLFGKNIPNSELVIAVRYENQIIALFNLEHRTENIFSQYHISLLKNVADILAPFIKALLLQEDMQKSKEKSLIYIMTDLLKRMVSVYRHKIYQLFPRSLLIIENLEETITRKKEVLSQLTSLKKLINEFQFRTETFLKDLPDYVNYGGIIISQQISDAINEFDPDALRTKDKIIIKFKPHDNNQKVYASSLLREHIYNLLKNSLDAIQDSLAKNRIKEGYINIKTYKEKVEDAYKRETSPPRIYVQIIDNGGGVPANIYSNIGKLGFTTKVGGKGGTGLGLYAATEYMRSVDGDLETKNETGKGFSVIFYLQEYDPDIHKEFKFGQEKEIFK